MKNAKLRVLGACAMIVLVALGCGGSEPQALDSSDEALTAQEMARGGADHAAMPEVTTVMLTTSTLLAPLDENLDAFNHTDPFNIGEGSYARVFAQNLARFDAYDRKTDWTPAQSKAWLARLASGNYLVLDTSKPCAFGTHTFLEIEREQLTGKPHQTCGGRMPNEDALDAVMNWLVRGPAASFDGPDAITDGVGRATKPSSDTFPYLAEAN